ncbi:MAG: hypothetical protein HYZ81_06075 [Nitrospinae bacterium]|nr:hypothetical protein [Nitrospinota bacterium]
MMQRLKSLRMWMGALTVIVLLSAWPAMVGAGDDSTIPEQLNWVQFPPASHPIDSRQLVEFLLNKGMFLSPQEMAMLERGEVPRAKASTQPCAPSRAVSR